MAIPTKSVWAEVSLPEFPTLDRDIDVDVLIVGAGVTGITTAYLLAQEGVRVALIDRERVASGDSVRTTAHLTYVTDARMSELVKRFGKDAARVFWQGGALAIDTIERIHEETAADAGFARVPGYLHAPVGQDPAEHVDSLQQDAELAQSLGFDATFMNSVPYAALPGVRFTDQARFHPRLYFKALLPVIQQQRGLIFENTAFEAVDDDRMTVRANGKKIRCDYLVIATHNPRMGKKGALTASLFQTKLALYTTYVLGARLPPDAVPVGLYWDLQDPYEYLRIDERPDHLYAIFGGADVKTGQEHDVEQVFWKLEVRLHQLLPQAQFERRWLGQVIETDDGMPFVGENEDREFIATGYFGNGYTLGTLSALMAQDRYLKRDNPWSSLFDVNRSPFHGGAWRYLQENVDYPYYYVRDRLRRPEAETLDAVARNEGKIISYQGKKVAAYRDGDGMLTLLAPQCTHMKCLVRWNSAASSWDCPCHGSRFRPTGEVLGGPAESPLQRLHE